MSILENKNARRLGKLIVIEGADRCGKSTLTKNLAKVLSSLKGKNKSLHVEELSFPNRKSPTGVVINQYLKSSISLNPQTIHLLFSANRWEELENINRILAGENNIIICDRYWFSGAAYTAAKGVDIEWSKRPDVGLPIPDIVVFIDLHPELASKRSGFGEEKYETIEYQKLCYQWLKKLVGDHENGMLVDGNLSENELTDLVVSKILNLYKE